MSDNFQTISRKNWNPDSSEAKSVGTIQLGALLRIAEATETMALRYTALLDEVKYYRQKAADLERALNSERHRSAYWFGRLRRTLAAKGVSK